MPPNKTSVSHTRGVRYFKLLILSSFKIGNNNNNNNNDDDDDDDDDINNNNNNMFYYNHSQH